MSQHEIIGLGSWLQSPAGHYLLDWEQSRMDEVVADIFGFHALQVGLPELDALRANRMPHRWVSADSFDGPDHPSAGPRASLIGLRCDPEALPFDAKSLDLVVLPHTLELAADPYHALNEVDRVLRPEGRVIILGFNPASLWAVRQHAGRLVRSAGIHRHRPPFLPADGEFLSVRRLRDWLRLLSFEVESGRYGCYRPAVQSPLWLERCAWMDPWGDRWWPVFGAAYYLVAVKRVRGMRLVGLARNQRRRGAGASATAVATPSRHHRCPPAPPSP